MVEPIGLRPKHWVTDATGTEWLRKQALTWRPAELAVEALTLELARRCGYSVAYGSCCTWQENGQTMRGFVSRKFQDPMEAQASGGEFVGGAAWNGQRCAPGLVAFFSNNLAMVESVLEAVPDDWLSARRKQLIGRVLVGGVKMLQGLTP
jgi:hypothetical protein